MAERNDSGGEGDTMKLPASGACQCGNVKYEVTKEPLVTVACHCSDCQKLSTSAFSVSMILDRSGFNILSGQLKSWTRGTAAGGTAVCWFCPDCGNRIFHENPAMPDVIRLKPGTLDDTTSIEPQAHVWTCREQRWLERCSELPRFEQQPDVAAALAAIARGEPPF
jgi:hypothetical protein